MPSRPEIFISAASRDLKSCRQLVRDALLTLGCVPVVQDHFPPGAGEVRAMLREKIAGCQAVIHLAGECYGFEPRERPAGEPRRSYTQMEYDIARELKKPLYTFLCTPDFPYDAHEPEPADLRLLQEEHRADLATTDHLYVPIKDTQELDLRVRELQTRVEHLSRDLDQTRSWLGRGLAVALAALALIGGALWLQHRQAAQTEQKVAAISGELDRYRQAVKALADDFGKDLEPGRVLTDQEKFDRALAAVAAQQRVSVAELKTWLTLFVAQVRTNPGADFYDRALADFAERHFADAVADATKAADQYRGQREAAQKEASSATQRASAAGVKERLALTLVGDSELAAGHYAATLAPYQQALALVDQTAEPLPWCDAAQKLSHALEKMGRYDDAGSMIRAVVAKRTQLLGAESPDTLSAVSDLAWLFMDQGDFTSAEPLYRNILAIREHTLGPEHPATLNALSNLGILLARKGDPAEAEAIDRRCLTAQERLLGPDDPETLRAAATLAELFDTTNRLPEAEALLRRNLAVQERTLGPDHPETLMTLNNLGNLLTDKGDLPGAEAAYRRVYENDKKTLGPDHPDTLALGGNLAEVIDARGDLAAAEAIYQETLAGMQRALTPVHPYRLDLDYYFSLLRQKQGRWADALPLAQDAATGAAQSLPASSKLRLTYEKNLQEVRAKLTAAAR